MGDAHDDFEAAVACERNFHNTGCHGDGPIHIDRRCFKCSHLVRYLKILIFSLGVELDCIFTQAMEKLASEV